MRRLLMLLMVAILTAAVMGFSAVSASAQFDDESCSPAFLSILQDEQGDAETDPEGGDSQAGCFDKADE